MEGALWTSYVILVGGGSLFIVFLGGGGRRCRLVEIHLLFPLSAPQPLPKDKKEIGKHLPRPAIRVTPVGTQNGPKTSNQPKVPFLSISASTQTPIRDSRKKKGKQTQKCHKPLSASFPRQHGNISRNTRGLRREI